MDAAAALIPIKAFHEAKARLRGALDPLQRDRLARWTASQVMSAAAGLQLVVVCDDDAVATWAGERGALVLWQAGKGLNNAVDDAVAALADLGFDHVVVAHADLPRPSLLRTVVRPGTITLVPDRRDDGTNVMSFPTRAAAHSPTIARTGPPMRAAYGPGSFRRHLAAAMTTGLPVEVRRDRLLSLDIDTPADLAHPMIASAVAPVLSGATPPPDAAVLLGDAPRLEEVPPA